MSYSPVELRHKLHQNPELSFLEFETTKILIDNIKSLDGASKIKIHTPYKTGLLAEYTVNDGEYLLFRADIDALPIKEETSFEYKSKNEFMHACGHDIHTSILYSFLSEVLKNDYKHNMLFLFQPAEETGGGAMEFYGTGIFDKFKIKNAFALHVTDEYDKGVIASTSGVLFASSLEVDIEFHGVSSHVAFPKKGKNAFNALRQFVNSVDMMPRDVNEPFIFGIGKVYSGEVRNIVPHFAKLEGTMRGLNSEKVLSYYDKIAEVLKGVEALTKVKTEIKRGAHYPEVVIDAALYSRISYILKNNFEFINCGYKMTGEDFGFFSHKFPSFMFWLGVSKGEQFGLHNPKFLPDDDIIEIGKSAFLQILNSYL
jgi:N-acetyldiaminopimelate deacetylase